MEPKLTCEFDLADVMAVAQRAATRWSSRVNYVEYDDLFQEIMLSWITCKQEIRNLNQWVFGKAKQKSIDLNREYMLFSNSAEFVYTNGMVEQKLYDRDLATMTALESLPALHRDILRAYYFEEVVIEAQSNDYKRLKRALSKLTNKLNILLSGYDHDGPGSRRTRRNESLRDMVEVAYRGENMAYPVPTEE